MNRADLKAAIWEASKAHNEHRDCTVKALAVATGEPYAKVHRAMAEAGRKPRRGAHIHVMERAAEAMGYSVTRVARRNAEGRPNFTAKTVRTAERDRRLANMGRLFLSMSGHVAGMIDGKVLDWTEGRLHRIRAAYVVERMSTDQIDDRTEVKAMAPMTQFDQQSLF